MARPLSPFAESRVFQLGSAERCPKFAPAERWVNRRLGTVRHERRVASICANLFDITRPLHGLTLADRRLLRLAALVHDVGRSICKAEHPAEGAWMLLADKALPLTAAERRSLAYLTLYHRGAVPPAGADAILHADDDHERLLQILALLRSADGLDGRSLDPGRLVFALFQRDRRLGVTCYLQDDSEIARRVYARRKKFRLLEQLLDVRVEVTVELAEALRLVA